jgi:phenylalanyl-tRNA synthetase beta chain
MVGFVPILSIMGVMETRQSSLAHGQASVASFAGPLLESAQIVRQYCGASLEEGRKSVSFRLTVGSPERTLSSEEVGEIRARIIEGMRELGYELRV